MNKKILAITISAVLVISLLMPAGMNAQAKRVGTEQNAISQITTNLQQIIGLLQGVNFDVNDVREDLKIKKKFFQETLDNGKGQGLQGGTVNEVQLIAHGCPENLPSQLQEEPDGTVPCAFNVESLIVGTTGAGGSNPRCNVDTLQIDGLESNIPDVDVSNAKKNILLEDSIPSIGASHEVHVHVTCQNTAFIFVEFNGERPEITEFDVKLVIDQG